MSNATHGLIRVIVVDDHPVVRTGIRYMLETQADFSVAAEAGDAVETLSLAAALHWDVLLLDLALPDMPGLDALKLIKKTYPNRPVLVLSGYPENRFGALAAGAGAAGYVQKAADPSELFRALRTVVRGNAYRAAPHPDKPDFKTCRTGRPHSALSPRELEVFCGLAAGATCKDIAARLHLSDKTISTFRTRLLGKMGLNSNADLILYAIQNNLVPGGGPIKGGL